MVHHCLLKEAHTISYVQQANHEWIEGDEEKTTYAQAIKSLRVVPTNIQHGPEVLQRFKAAHKPLLKALLVLRTWRAMANRLSQYFVNSSPGHHLRKELH
jgi:hypothetical protein